MAIYSRSSIQNINNRQFNNEPDIDKIYLYAKDPYRAEYQFLINKGESTVLKAF